MKTRPRNSKAFSLVELLVVLATLAILAALLFPMPSRAKARAKRIQCVNNLRSLGIGFHLVANDAGTYFPLQFSTNRAGSNDVASDPETFRHFQALADEILIPKLLVCPADERKPVKNFDQLSNQNISYFAGVNATETNLNMFLAGDRNLTLDKVKVKSGVFDLTTNANVGWSEELHNRSGFLGLVDGSVQGLNSSRLADQNRLAEEPNRLSIP